MSNRRYISGSVHVRPPSPQPLAHG
jgi:hypothetical protein